MGAAAEDHAGRGRHPGVEEPGAGPAEVPPSRARTTSPHAMAPPAARWLARGAFAAAVAAAVVLVAFSLNGGVRLLLVAALGLVVVVGSAWWFLAVRGILRWLALALVVLTPVVVAWLFIRANLLWVALVVLALVAAAGGLGKTALAREAHPTGMPEYEFPPPQRPFVVMNPRSGGGKVARFGLKEKAEALGAEVVLLEGPGTVDVAAVAREAVARGADLLGVAGGDGTQALVAGVAAEHDVPFLVISAGTRNHFALDLGLDREDPSTCLAALTDDAVELRVDLGVIGGRTFVNNASFGAYAAVVQSPAYRDDKTGTTLDDAARPAHRARGARLWRTPTASTLDGPQAVLVSDNPYGTGDLAGLGRRARLDTGRARHGGHHGRQRPAGGRPAAAHPRQRADRPGDARGGRQRRHRADPGRDRRRGRACCPRPCTARIRPGRCASASPATAPGCHRRGRPSAGCGCAGWRPSTDSHGTTHDDTHAGGEAAPHGGLAATLERVRRELGVLDLAVYDAVASTPSPTIDAGLARVSNAANHSRLWIVTAGVVSLFGKDQRRSALVALAAVGATSAVSNLAIKPASEPRPAAAHGVQPDPRGPACRSPTRSRPATPPRRSPSPPRSAPRSLLWQRRCG